MKIAAFLTANVLAFLIGWEVGANGIIIPLPDIIPNIVPVDPPPVPGEGQHVLLIEESEDRSRLPSGQLAIITSVDLRAWLSSQGWDWRIWDQHMDASLDDGWFRQAAGLSRSSIPWVIISNGRQGYSGPLPPTVGELKSLIGRYGP